MTDTPNSIEKIRAALKPCPFCGGEMKWSVAGDYALHVGYSEDCPIHNQGFTNAEAWNTRADLLTASEAELHTLKTAGICEVAARNPSVMEYMRHWEARAEAAEAERDRLAEKLAVYEAKEAAYSARLQEHFRVKQQCDRCGHQSIEWLGENAACPRHSCSGGMVALANMEKTDNG